MDLVGRRPRLIGGDGGQDTLFSGAATYVTANYFQVLGVHPVRGAGLPGTFPTPGATRRWWR